MDSVILLNAQNAANTDTPEVMWSIVSLITNKFALQGAPFFALLIGGILLCMAIPYLLGSLNFAIIFSKLFFNDDIRKYGSKNAGMTNMLRTYGKLPALATLICDMLKGAAAVILGRLILGSWGSAVAGLFVVLGHMFPCFYKFKGGKGVATTAMVVLATDPLVFAVLLLIFLIIVIGTKFVSLGSVMCMMIYPYILAKMTDLQYTAPNVLSAAIIAALVIFMHRSNIKRLWEGTESKISLKSKKKQSEEKEKKESDK